MYFTGFADEASGDLDVQIEVTRELGWKNIETRALCGGRNLAALTDEEFAQVEERLETAGVHFNCYGSGIANWSRPITEDPESSYDELRRAIPRMRRLGTGMVRIMSFAVPQELKARAWEYEDEVVRRLQVLVRMAEDAGIVCVHENCMDWGGLSYEHTLRLCERIQSSCFRLVFDTGNPLFNADHAAGAAPGRMQDSWEFYRNVKEFVAYIHIKDGVYDPAAGRMVFSFPGEGGGHVREILADLLGDGYDGGISIEPHMGHVFHAEGQDPQAAAEFRRRNYVEYGRRLERLVDGIRRGTAPEPRPPAEG